MAVFLVNNGQLKLANGEEFSNLNDFCLKFSRDLTFEWIGGQYWLHSDSPSEKPIGIPIDEILDRHENFFKKSSLHKEPLARAIGIKGALRPRVLDLTAGLLGDSLLFLSFGMKVWSVERHPVIQFLIHSALKNAHHSKISEFHFLANDATTILAQIPEVDTIYYDPMYEEPNQKTKPRKEMRIFRNVVGKDSDTIEIFEQVMALKVKRFVIKRPKNSPYLFKKPSVEYLGKSTRYDVYFSV